MRCVVRCFRELSLWLMTAIALVPEALAQQVTTIEHIMFETNAASRSPATPVLLRALLYVPAKVELPVPAVVMTPSSGGVRDDVEIHYASHLARSGIAALVIDSFGARGVTHTIHDQRLVDSWAIVHDAIAGLRLLLADNRFKRDRIGIMGVSKGGIVAMNTALVSVLKWAGASEFNLPPTSRSFPTAVGFRGPFRRPERRCCFCWPSLMTKARRTTVCAMPSACGTAAIPISKSTCTRALITRGKSSGQHRISTNGPRTSPGAGQSWMRMEAAPLLMAL